MLFDQFFNCKQNENERVVRRQQAAGNQFRESAGQVSAAAAKACPLITL